MRLKGVHAGADEGHILIAKAQQRAQRRAKVAVVGDLAKHGVILARVQNALALFEDDARIAVVLFRLAAQDAPGLLLAHALFAAESTQFFHALIAHPLGVEQQPLRQFRARRNKRQRRKEAEGVAVRQFARIRFQFRHVLTPSSSFYSYYTGRSRKKRGG